MICESYLLFVFIVSENHKRSRQTRDAIIALGYNAKYVFELMLNTAEFEFVLKEVNFCLFQYEIYSAESC